MLPIVRLAAGLLLAAIALLTVIPAPAARLWLVEVGATEFGYWLVLPGLLLLGPGLRKTPGAFTGGLLGAAAAAVLVMPAVRATSIARDLPSHLTAAFGEPRARPQFADRPRSEPFVVMDLLRSVRSNPVRYRELPYLEIDGQRLIADVYEPSYPHGAIPAVIVVHGGSWSSGASGELAALNGYLAARDYLVFDVNYRLAPRAPFPAARDDVRAAVEFVKQNAKTLGVDPGRLALLGRSAGAQIAMLVAYTSHDPAIRGVISFYGPADLRWGYDNPANPRVSPSRAILEAYLGGPPDRAGAAYDAAAPINAVSRDTPPTLLIHGLRDEIVSPVHADHLVERLRAAGVKHYYLRLPWATHGCDYLFSGPSGQLTTYAVERFLGAVMKEEPTPQAPAKKRG